MTSYERPVWHSVDYVLWTLASKLVIVPYNGGAGALLWDDHFLETLL